MARRPRRRPVAAALATAGLALLAGCSPTIATHGHQIDERRVALLRPGVTSREEVQRILGTPSSVATFDDRSWYYISQRSERANFFQERTISQDVVRVTFDERGLVTDLGKIDLAMAQRVDPDPERTRTMGNELNVLEEFLSNIGRFNSDRLEGGIRGDRRGGM